MNADTGSMADRVQQPRHGHLELGNSCVDAVGANDKLTAVKMSDEAGTKKDKVIVTIDEHRPESVADRDDKTPPPESKQGGGGRGGIREFFMRRFFSHELRRDRKYYESLSLEEKRKLYTCGRDFLTLDEIETWEEFRKKLKPSKHKLSQSEYRHSSVLNEKVSLWRGDITKLEIDAIVNAANSSLLGGGGVDGAIHRAAGYSLKEEYATLNGCETGDAKITSGHRLPGKYVLHTVGPINGSETKLRSCYERCLQLVLENDIRSVAFCCIATGVYGYPNEDAAHVALETTRKWLESHADKVDRIIFCVFLKDDYKIYGELLHHYFPPEESVTKEREEEPVAREGEKEGLAAESEAMETQDGGSPTVATDSKDIAEEPSNNDEFEIVDKDNPPVPTLQKSITEPAQRVPSKPESDEKTEPLEPGPPTGAATKSEAMETQDGRSPTATIDAAVPLVSSRELETEREQRRHVEKRLEEETARAEREKRKAEEERVRANAAEHRLEHQTHQLQQQVEEQVQEIHQLNDIIYQRENRIQELEQSVAELQVHKARLEQSVTEIQEREAYIEQQLHQKQRQLANSDSTFQDIFQRLLGQVPQSQPHWVVQRDEIQLTEEQLGAGGWAVVKVAIFRGQRVAAKCLHNQIISAHNVRLFTREMNMAAHARHPNLLQFIGATMDNNPIILTEFMPTSLRRVLEQGNPLSHGQIISIVSDVARALNYLHLTSPDPIIHRDVSSANVLLKSSAGDNYEAKLSDYGSANFVRYATTVGPGNPLYSAPEVNDPKQHSPKMDIYSLGLLLVEMCSGELFDDYEELIHTRIAVDWPEMVAVIRPCIRQDPRRRPSTADIIIQLEQLY